MVREENQDSWGKFPAENLDLSQPQGQLFIVADGMGGHRGGRQASELAVKSVEHAYFVDSSKNIPDRLEAAFQIANADIYEYSINNPAFAGMGTTCTALVLQNDHGYIAHVGDSRLYRFSKEGLEQLTRDHSTIAEMHRRGLITREEAKHHPHKNQLYRALGVRPAAEVDLRDDVTLTGEECFLLCSDGLTNHVDEEELYQIVFGIPPQKACEKLVELANERGGFDNITVEIVAVNFANSLLGRIIGS